MKKYDGISVLSVVILLSLVIIPISTGWLLGIFPEAEDYGHGLFDEIAELMEDGTEAWDDIVVKGNIYASICALAMFIASMCRSKIMSVISALSGTVTMLWFMVKTIEYNDLDAVFDFENCGTTIGFWIVLISFAVCLCLSVAISSDNSNASSESSDDNETGS